MPFNNSRIHILLKLTQNIPQDRSHSGPLKINLKEHRDFPGGPVVKNPPSNTGDTGSIPSRGTKIPHAAWQLSPRTTTTEPAHLN